MIALVMRVPTDYTVISDYTLEMLIERVNDFMNQGYEPAGGLAMVPVQGSVQYHQAMVRYVGASESQSA